MSTAPPAIHDGSQLPRGQPTRLAGTPRYVSQLQHPAAESRPLEPSQSPGTQTLQSLEQGQGGYSSHSHDRYLPSSARDCSVSILLGNRGNKRARHPGTPLPLSAVVEAGSADSTAYWNAVNVQDGKKDKNIYFHWADQFPIRTQTVLRVAIVDPKTVQQLYPACWEQNANVSDEFVLEKVLNKAGYNGADSISKANVTAIKTKLRELAAEAKEKGICDAPSYRVLRGSGKGE
ncbi:hypothetical protein BKA63DRAFT_492407 [Paraphoma chrysanthemicola]|nr:hypothetical protein BKA63DRAFT_492407 [Paraphoma chrysanthemicola]